MSDSTGESESTAAASSTSEAADRSEPGLGSSALTGPDQRANGTDELPDISDVVGATTGPLRFADDPAPTAPTYRTDDDPDDGGVPDDDIPEPSAGWAAPEAEDLREAVTPAHPPSTDGDGASAGDGAGTAAETEIGPTGPDESGSGKGSTADTATTGDPGDGPAAGTDPVPATTPGNDEFLGSATEHPTTTVSDNPAPDTTSDGQAAAETVLVGTETVQMPPITGGPVVDGDHPRPPDSSAADATVQIPTADPTGTLSTRPVADALTLPSPEAAPSPAVAAATAAATVTGTIPVQPGVDPTGELAVEAERRLKGRRGKQRRTGRVALIAIVGLIALYLGAFAVDSILTSGQVQRNTSLGTTPIGGMDQAELAAVLDGLDADLAAAPLSVAVGPTTIDTDPAALGGRLDRDAIEDAAF
ncbi:MAG: hypothetical protein OEV40_28330, partial [Acidimicrobiia bacterium]|nr:hypothetical protein [Acidimicrobiia bacterium]